MLQVTKTFLPDFDEYVQRIKPLWESHWLTNNGAMVQELEGALKKLLRAEHLLFTNNGTIVLQMALKALNIQKEVITTPFSYVATTNSILWEGAKPRFVDIQPTDLNIDVQKIEEKINAETQAILVTHVFGNPCDVEGIEALARKHHLKVIYDAAHAFGVTYKNRSLFSYGDISTCSFHATKVFHTVEGGMIQVNQDEDLFRKLMLYRQFGHYGDDYYDIGINGKSSELHAAMGLCVLNYLTDIISKRKQICAWYDHSLQGLPIQKPISPFAEDLQYNYAYYPVLVPSENLLLEVKNEMERAGIIARRYFYPSLNTLPFLKEQERCPVSEEASSRILSLPLSTYTSEEEVQQVASLLRKIIG